ncbi:hypothetical protein [Peribacillus frigoritolerans]|uniref:hypothetical protein n=1 Tax=Peribacillus frigoritolerans TaxID=450367 RepID=UPI0022818908|nr:hypothetical protein [Peribacillus frigoritolerans]MCY8935668.1 hypothetical protein [Peribacillus frigoritolerans]
MVFTNIFFDVNGNFQWASIAAFVAFFGSIISAWISVHNTKKSLKGNVVSTARIEWIQEVRKKSVDLISACYSLFEFIKSDSTTGDEAELSKVKNEIEKNGILLILYFGPDSNKNNDFIVYLVTNLLSRITNKDGYYDDNKIPELIDQVNVLKDFLRIYFKAEWKRANGEIKDIEVESYLEKQDLYNAIMDIFSSGFEMHREWTENYYFQLSKKYKEEN